MLLETNYDQNQPNNHNNFRPRDYKMENTTPIMKYTHKDMRERIKDHLSSGVPPLSTEVF
jgi:hypothetical protein